MINFQVQEEKDMMKEKDEDMISRKGDGLSNTLCNQKELKEKCLVNRRNKVKSTQAIFPRSFIESL